MTRISEIRIPQKVVVIQIREISCNKHDKIKVF